MNRIIVSTYLPSMYIPDQPFSSPTAPIRVLSLENGEKISRDLKGVEAITSPNYVTGLAAALLSKVSAPYLWSCDIPYLWLRQSHPQPSHQPSHMNAHNQSNLKLVASESLQFSSYTHHPQNPPHHSFYFHSQSPQFQILKSSIHSRNSLIPRPSSS